MPATVEIQWPLGGGTSVSKTFYPVVRVHDGVGGIPGASHKLHFVLKKSTVDKDDQRSGPINVALDKTYADTPLTTDEYGAHSLLVELEHWSGSTAVVVDSDFEDGINVADGGVSKRESGSIINEE